MEKISKKGSNQPPAAFMNSLIKADSISRNTGGATGLSSGATTDPESIFSKDEKTRLTKFVAANLSKDGKPSLDEILLLPQLQVHPLFKRLAVVLNSVFGSEKLEPNQMQRLFVIFHPKFDTNARIDCKMIFGIA